MSYDTLNQLFKISLVLTIVFFVLGIILFFAFQVPKIVGDLTGRNAKKAIDSIREKNNETMIYRSKAKEKSKKQRKSGRKVKSNNVDDKNNYKNSSENKNKNNDKNYNENSDKDNNGNKDKNYEGGKTANRNETADLSNIRETSVLQDEKMYFELVIEQDITYIHTSEII